MLLQSRSGIYIAILFVMWQAVNLAVFRDPPAAPVMLGGVLIVAGATLVTFLEIICVPR